MPVPPSLALPEPDTWLPYAGSFSRGVVWTAVLIGLVIGASNLAPWFLPAVQHWVSAPGYMIMRANASAAVVLAALSLLGWLMTQKLPRFTWFNSIASVLGLGVALIGGLTAFQDLSGLDLGVDTLLAAATFPGDHAHVWVASPGRMSLNASLAMFFIGLALWGMDWTVSVGRLKSIFTAPIFAVMAALPAAFGLIGYVAATGKFTGILASTNILIHTAVALLALAIGTLAVRPERHPVRRMLSRSAGGMLLRWMLPGSTLSLLILSWLIAYGKNEGVIANGEGRALMLFGGVLLFHGLIVSVSRAVDHEEAKAWRARSALRDEELRSRSLLETAQDAVVIVGADGCIMDWNAAAERIFGWSRQEVVGQPLAPLIVPLSHRDNHENGFARFIASGQSTVLGQRMELPALRRDGTEFPAELSVNAVRDMTPPVFVGFIRDITERRRGERALREAKEQAEKASQAKDDFLAALSHELRTPLTPVLLTSSVMCKDTRLPEDARQALAMIERHVSLEARLIDDLLDLTRIAKGKLLLRPEACDVHALLRHALDIIHDDAQAKDLQMALHLDADRPVLLADPSRIQQVFWNLLKNAVKFTPSGGSIRVASTMRGGGGEGPGGRATLTVTIQDTGIGFLPEMAEQIFLPFEQEKMEVQFGGLGLGLAIARAIVHLHEGSITASSQGPGSGAVFTVSLPCRQSPPPLPGRGTPVAEPSKTEQTRPLKILLVEDHDPTRQVLARLLSRNGHQVTAVGSVAEALMAFDAEPASPDVLISDVGLPDGSGMDLMQQLATRCPALRGIALSGYGMEDDVQRTLGAGFSHHLVKPVKFDQLQKALAEILP